MQARAPDSQPRATLADFDALPEGTRAELIDGVIVNMASPSTVHQRVERKLVRLLDEYLDGKRCEVFHELDVQIDEAEDEIFRPDLVVVCDPSKVKQRRIVGIPDLVVEILSPSTAGRDNVTKLNRYIEAGVPEYWIVNPDKKSVLAFRASGSHGRFERYISPDIIPVSVLPGFQIDLASIFPPSAE